VHEDPCEAVACLADAAVLDCDADGRVLRASEPVAGLLDPLPARVELEDLRCGEVLPLAEGVGALLVRDGAEPRVLLAATSSFETRFLDDAARLHRECLAVLSRSFARDVGDSLAILAFHLDDAALSADARRTLRDASRRLQTSVDALLAHSHLGPRVSIEVPLGELTARVVGAAAPLLNERGQRLVIDAPGNASVRGNPIALEYVVVSALRCAPLAHVGGTLRLHAVLEPRHVALRISGERTVGTESNLRPVWQNVEGALEELDGEARLLDDALELRLARGADG